MKKLLFMSQLTSKDCYWKVCILPLSFTLPETETGFLPSHYFHLQGLKICQLCLTVLQWQVSWSMWNLIVHQCGASNCFNVREKWWLPSLKFITVKKISSVSPNGLLHCCKCLHYISMLQARLNFKEFLREDKFIWTKYKNHFSCCKIIMPLWQTYPIFYTGFYQPDTFWS